MNIPASTTTPTAQPPPENIYYGDGSVWVTNQRLISGARTFRLKNITRARLRVFRAENQRRVLLTGPVVILAMCLAMLINLRDTTLDSPNLVDLGAAFCFGFLFLCSLGAIVYTPIYAQTLPREDIYSLSLVERFWPSTAVVSTDRGYIEGIAQAVEHAISRNNANPQAAGDTNTVVSPESPPIATINGSTLRVGASEYDLTNVKSATSGVAQPFPWITLVIPAAITIQQVINYIDRHTGGPPLLFAGLSCLLALSIFIYLVFFFVNITQWVHTVILRTNRGSTTVFASFDQTQTKRLTAEIQQALQTSPTHAPIPTS
jgi:hypothetical protein